MKSVKLATTEVTTSPALESQAAAAVNRSRSDSAGYAGNQAALRRLSRTTPHVQCKLQIGAVNDPPEAEADRVADQVMRMSDPNISIAVSTPQISRECAGCEEEEDKKLHAKPAGAALTDEAPALVHNVLRSPGQPLDGPTRASLEPRFSADFADVRLHTDAPAAESAQAVGALAYAVGRDLVFAAGAYAPASHAGQRLLAHELTHVMQNGYGGGSTLRRDMPDAGAGPAQPQPQPVSTTGTNTAAPTGAGPSDAGTGPAQPQPAICPQVTPACPAEYCKPFSSQQEAEQDRTTNGEGLLGDIRMLNSRAEPLFRQFVFNPGPAGDISSTYANDFSNCAVSRDTTQALLQKVQTALQANLPSIPPGGAVTLNITSVIPPQELATFMCRMVFDDYTSVPGLIAGGVGETQESEKIGKNTSSRVNDSRSASGTITVTRNSDGSFGINPDITYTVVDTLDFCPGNCGGSSAQKLTVPLSRWEASSISGDVPFKVVFPAPSLVGAFDSEEG